MENNNFRVLILLTALIAHASLVLASDLTGQFEKNKGACNNKNNAASCLQVAVDYFAANGTKRDLAQAVFYSEKVCNEGEAEGCTMAGGQYFLGFESIEKNYFKSAELYKKSCDLNDGLGCALYANMFVYEWGVEASEEKARKYFVKACDIELKHWGRRRAACDGYDDLERVFGHLRKRLGKEYGR